MHLDLPHLSFSGPPVDDPGILGRLPNMLADALIGRNGCLGWRGAFHVRGACLEPAWHSLRGALEGPDAFHRLYPEVFESDIPWAEDAFGDQFLIRGTAIFRLFAESAELEARAESLEQFFESLLADPSAALGFEPADAMNAVGGELRPGQLLSVYPPFGTEEAAAGVTIRAIDALERRRWLAGFASQLRKLPDGSRVRIDPIL